MTYLLAPPRGTAIRVIAYTTDEADARSISNIYEMRGNKPTWKWWWPVIRRDNPGHKFAIERSTPYPY